EFGNMSDALLKSGDFQSALEAAELGMEFDPNLIWIAINKAHALMFLGKLDEAKAIYLEHKGKSIEQGKWDQVVVEDFGRLRAEQRCHPLMNDIATMLGGSLPEAANCSPDGSSR